MLLKAAMFLLPSSLLGRLLNHSIQFVSSYMPLWELFRLLKLIMGRLFNMIADQTEAEWSSKFHSCSPRKFKIINVKTFCYGLPALSLSSFCFQSMVCRRYGLIVLNQKFPTVVATAKGWRHSNKRENDKHDCMSKSERFGIFPPPLCHHLLSSHRLGSFT